MGLFAYAVFAGAVLFSLGEMGFLTEAADRFISFCLVLAFVAMHVEWRPKRFRAGHLLAGIALLAAAILARGAEAWRLAALSLVPMAACAAMREDDPRRGEAALFVPAVAFFLAAYLAVRHLPHLWWLADHASVLFSRAAGRAVGQDYFFSATQSGFRVMLFAACWGLARLAWAERRSFRAYALFLLMLAGVTAAVEMLLTALAIAIQLWYGDMVFLLFNPQALYLLASLAPVAWYARRPRGSPADAGAPHAAPGPAQATLPAPGPIAVALLAGVLLGLGLTLGPGPVPALPRGEVLIVDEGLLNWRTPVFGLYGERSGGMFGRLPGFLDAQGYDSRRVPRPITGETLDGARTLVVINLRDAFSEEEKQAVWDFVWRGGSLLVLGDHTGVGGIREPFNHLLQPVNIEFEFDCATFWSQGWRDALELMPHPINRAIIDSEDIQIWIGASLAVRPPARPVIVGKYGYSDIGDEANVDMSYLGDRRHNPGERIGDLVLVAEARHGDGRVLVFGDTSPFQNGALVSSWAFAQRVFLWLAGDPRRIPLWLNAALIGAGLALLIAALSLRGAFRPAAAGFDPGRGARKASAFAFIALALGIALSAGLAGRVSRLHPLPRIDLPKALVDFSHGERFDMLTWYEDCIGGLELNLMRNGYSAHLMREFSAPLLLDSRVLVVIAPSMPFKSAEMEAVETFMEQGGLLILSTGFEEKDRSGPLLGRLGLELENVPLAHFDAVIFGRDVRFAEAWPLKASGPGTVPVALHPEYPNPVMVFVSRGEGGALVIGDSQFLLNSNLEMMEEWQEENILFLREVFDRHRRRELGT